MLNLTDLSIQSLPQGYHWDAKVSGFGVRIGKKRTTWLIVKGANRTKVTLGHYPSLSLKEARRKAQLALATPATTNAPITFLEALDAFLAQDRWKARSKYVLEHSLRWHFKWKRQLDKIIHEDVAQVLDQIPGKSARAHALKDIRTFFNWCVPRYLARSPAEGLAMPAYVPRERVLNDAELKAVWNACNSLDRYGVQVQVLILTGQRVNQWLQYDPAWLQGDLVTFPAQVMKGNRNHTIPIGPMTLERLPELITRSMQGKKKRDLDTKADVTEWVLHDLRRVLASQWAALGIPLPTIEAYLSHRSHSFAGIVSVYQKHSWIPEMRQAVKIWENRLQSLVR